MLMRNVRLLLFCGMLVGPCFAENRVLTPFDDGFFEPGDPATSTLETLDPDYFSHLQSQQLGPNSPGSWHCSAVEANSPSQKSARLTAIVNARCASTPTIVWLPNQPNRWGTNAKRGHIQVCCYGKQPSEAGRRRTR